MSLNLEAKKYYKLKIELINGEKLVGIVTDLTDSTIHLLGISRRKNIPDSTLWSRTLSFTEIGSIKSKKLSAAEPAIGAIAGLVTGLAISASQGPCSDDLSGLDCEFNKMALVVYPTLGGAIVGFLLVLPKNFKIEGNRSEFKVFYNYIQSRARLNG
jgi:hypothetical protein